MLCCCFCWVWSWVNPILLWVYEVIELIISYFFSPVPPPKHQKPFGHVAVIGAGISGISSASQLVSQGFHVTIFEEASETGGIWANVNSTSGLQINSILYRFHPLVYWTSWYPHRDQVLENVRKIWETYKLKDCTRFNTKVSKVERAASSTKLEGKDGQSRWIINGNQSEVFDGLIVTIGTCGKPKMLHLPNQENFKGKIVHSSQLDNVDFQNKNVVIVGGGASGVEALELAAKKGANKPTIIARSDKWIIPRNVVTDSLLSLQPFGREMPLSSIPEYLIKRFHYRDLQEKMAPTQGFYTGTPIVNDEVLSLVRQGKADYQRGDILEVKATGIEYNARSRNQAKGQDGEKKFNKADVIVLACGFERPSMDFLPKDLFPDGYSPPNMYLQVFPVEDWSICCTNSTFHNAIGTVGHVHIGIYARILTLFLNDPSTRPSPKDMRLWVDCIRWIKENAPGGQLEFFTYMEMCVWYLLFLGLRYSRLHYCFYILNGYGYWHKDPVTHKPKFYLTISNILYRLRNGLVKQRADFVLKNAKQKSN
ncbi:hypothetical protein MYAM1_004023 [Malassezia yamatoensis]|uniref:Flavin-containing monooxygenase n=1 Tax=Malassezia yamatoensis TaxID=253288 RepID=A0AAJ6CJI3_9BASI|nr:hypothetical protein MYAM1_004023 [Malassezia yamatoensis]